MSRAKVNENGLAKTSPLNTMRIMRKTKKSEHQSLSTAKDQVRKHVAAIHTSGDLSLLERKMANVLLLNAYDLLLTRRTHKLPLKHLCVMLGWDESNNIERLQDALRKLASTAIEFNMMEDGKEVWRVMSMISFGEIKEGMCTYRYDEYLAERLFDPEVYAIINIGMQRRFEGGYALTLYENCLRYKEVGSTGWLELERFRRIMGATQLSYDEFKYLKRDVIAKPVNEINRISDIQIAPEFQKQGRKISAVRFLIKDNPQQTLFKPNVMDEHAEIRESETFSRLREHGIGERLAIAWILQDEPRARAVVAYVEEKDRKKKVRSTAGLIRILIESRAEVGATEYEKKKAKGAEAEKEAAQKEALRGRGAELEADYQKNLVNETINALTLEEKRVYAATYIAGEGKGRTLSYKAESADFANSLERIQFMVWLRMTIAATIKVKSTASTGGDVPFSNIR